MCTEPAADSGCRPFGLGKAKPTDLFGMFTSFCQGRDTVLKHLCSLPLLVLENPLGSSWGAETNHTVVFSQCALPVTSRLRRYWNAYTQMFCLIKAFKGVMVVQFHYRVSNSNACKIYAHVCTTLNQTPVSHALLRKDRQST